jgi:hypothetical protein
MNLEELKARDIRRMSLAELQEFAELLEAAAGEVRGAIKYERTSARHPVALKHEEFAEARLDAAILYFASVRARGMS